MRGRALAVAAAALALSPARAEAHLVGVAFGDFYAGALHLLLAPEHVAAIVALGLVAALRPAETARWALAGLPLGLTAGVGIAFAAPGLFAPAPTVALSLAVLGVVGVAALPLGPVAIGAVSAATGFVHGFVNGLAPGDAGLDLLLYASGVVAAGTVLGTLAAAALSEAAKGAAWRRLVPRVVASWIGAVGLVTFGLSVAT